MLVNKEYNGLKTEQQYCFPVFYKWLKPQSSFEANSNHIKSGNLIGLPSLIILLIYSIIVEYFYLTRRESRCYWTYLIMRTQHSVHVTNWTLMNAHLRIVKHKKHKRIPGKTVRFQLLIFGGYPPPDQSHIYKWISTGTQIHNFRSTSMLVELWDTCYSLLFIIYIYLLFRKLEQDLLSGILDYLWNLFHNLILSLLRNISQRDTFSPIVNLSTMMYR